jgi:hypothetical protein
MSRGSFRSRTWSGRGRTPVASLGNTLDLHAVRTSWGFTLKPGFEGAIGNCEPGRRQNSTVCGRQNSHCVRTRGPRTNVRTLSGADAVRVWWAQVVWCPFHQVNLKQQILGPGSPAARVAAPGMFFMMFMMSGCFLFSHVEAVSFVVVHESALLLPEYSNGKMLCLRARQRLSSRTHG